MAVPIRGNIGRYAFGIALGVMMFFGLKAGVPWVQRQMMASPGFEQEALADPTAGPLFRTMKDTYPQDFARFMAEIGTRAKAGEPMDAIRAGAFTQMRAFTMRKMSTVGQAPDAALVQLADVQRNTVQALAAQDAELCAQFASTGLKPTAKPNAAAMRAVGEAGSALLRTAKAGEVTPAGRNLAADPARLDRLTARLTADGMTRDDFALLATPASLAAAPAARQCDIAKKLYAGIAQLPDAEKAWITAFLTNEAAKAMGAVPAG